MPTLGLSPGKKTFFFVSIPWIFERIWGQWYFPISILFFLSFAKSQNLNLDLKRLPIWKCIFPSSQITRRWPRWKIIIMPANVQQDNPPPPHHDHHRRHLWRPPAAVSRAVIVLWSRGLCLSNYLPTHLSSTFNIQTWTSKERTNYTSGTTSQVSFRERVQKMKILVGVTNR